MENVDYPQPEVPLLVLLRQKKTSVISFPAAHADAVKEKPMLRNKPGQPIPISSIIEHSTIYIHLHGKPASQAQSIVIKHSTQGPPPPSACSGTPFLKHGYVSTGVQLCSGRELLAASCVIPPLALPVLCQRGYK